MVKKLSLILISTVVVMVLVVIYITTNTHNHNNRYSQFIHSEKGCLKKYEKKVEYRRLPEDCINVLNNEYCICKNSIDESKDVATQYPELSETIYLYNIKNGTKEKIANLEKGYNSINYIFENNHIYWIEHYVNRDKNVSGNWKIKEYSVEGKKIKIIDEGNFEDFEKYEFEDINFADSSMLYPANIDVSNNNMVYNRIREKNGNLVFEIVLYNIENSSFSVIAQGDDYRNEYLYDVAISGDTIIYSKYHEKNDDKYFRPTTYKYCDLFMYNLKTKKETRLSEKDFLINIDIFDENIAAARVPEGEAGQDVFARMQIVTTSKTEEKWKIILDYKSPIYNNLKDLSIGNPTFSGNYLVWQDNTVMDNMYVYNYKENEFIKVPTPNVDSEFSIVGVKENNLFILETGKDGTSCMYSVVIK